MIKEIKNSINKNYTSSLKSFYSLSVIIIGVTLYFSLAVLWYFELTHKGDDEINYSQLIIPSICFLYLGSHVISTASLKKITIKENELEIFNYLKFKKTKYTKEEIKGYSISEDYRLKSPKKQILIYTIYSNVYEFTEIDFRNFQEIELNLNKYNYKKLGSENFKWRFLSRRYYSF